MTYLKVISVQRCFHQRQFLDANVQDIIIAITHTTSRWQLIIHLYVYSTCCLRLSFNTFLYVHGRKKFTPKIYLNKTEIIVAFIPVLHAHTTCCAVTNLLKAFPGSWRSNLFSNIFYLAVRHLKASQGHWVHDVCAWLRIDPQGRYSFFTAEVAAMGQQQDHCPAALFCTVMSGTKYTTIKYS